MPAPASTRTSTATPIRSKWRHFTLWRKVDDHRLPCRQQPPGRDNRSQQGRERWEFPAPALFQDRLDQAACCRRVVRDDPRDPLPAAPCVSSFSCSRSSSLYVTLLCSPFDAPSASADPYLTEPANCPSRESKATPKLVSFAIGGCVVSRKDQELACRSAEWLLRRWSCSDPSPLSLAAPQPRASSSTQHEDLSGNSESESIRALNFFLQCMTHNRFDRRRYCNTHRVKTRRRQREMLLHDRRNRRSFKRNFTGKASDRE